MSSAASDFKGLTGPGQSSSGYQSPTTTKSQFGGLYNDPRTSSTQSLTPSLPPYEEVERRKLLPPTQQHQHQHSHFKHRILGVVNLDAPLLGMHPGIIVAGLSSLFRKSEPPKVPGEQEEPSTQYALSPGTTGLPSPNISMYSMPSTITDSHPSPPPAPPPPFTRPTLTNEPNFNSTLPNDVRMEERTWWKNVVHFVKKHNSEGLIDAAANHVMSHLEFGGTMFEINNLKARYESIRKLEDVDDLKQAGFTQPQVRFIQYYTICNGYPKKPKEESLKREDTQSASIHDDSEKVLLSPSMSDYGPSLKSQSDIFKPDAKPLSLDSQSTIFKQDAKLLSLDPESEIFNQDTKPPSLSNSERSSLEFLSPEPIFDEPPSTARDDSFDMNKTTNTQPNEHHSDATPASGHDGTSSPTEKYPIEDKSLTADITHATAALDLDLPAVPELPPKPDTPNLDNYADKDARKLAEKEAKRAQKVYAQAVKDREKAIKEREKIVEKRRKKLAQEAEKQAKEDKKRRKKEEAAAAATTAAAAAVAATTTTPTTSAESGVSPSASNQEASEKRSALSNQGSLLPPPEWTPVSPDLTAQDTAAKKKDKEKAKEKIKDKEKVEKQHKFCNVPKSHGRVDPKWISVFMKDMDQVAAHTGLFFAGEHYESLVGDVGDIMVEWVHADLSKRTVLGLP
ncbi:hypothetical protein E0Z10_g4831 [Xylaria hypoxylon]|uniref:Uncharacterized protein n=1 Tax=Xylaria hypoxylon TaxID=37992 RepID=A0A4Z0YJA0_9PEZI|nr:hypothetical protein E0Z10_g4831 [Xylaria hypoxylon]